MVALIIPSRWLQQPQGRVEIDWAHPLAQGLVYYTIAGDVNPPDLVSGQLGSPINTARIVTGKYGRAFNSTAAAGSVGWSHPLTDTVKTVSAQMTLAMQCEIVNMPNNSKLFSIPYHFNTYSAPFFSIALGRSGSGSRFAFYNSDNTSTNMTIAPADNAIPIASQHTFVITRNGASAAWYRNGVDYALNVNNFSASPVIYGTGDKISLLNRSARSPGEGTQGWVYWSALWNRSLSEVESQEVYRNPYQWVRPVQSKLYYLPVGMTARTGTSAATLPLLSGAASGTVANRTATKPSGNLALAKTGQMSNATGYWAFNEGTGASTNLASPGTGNATLQAAAAYDTDSVGSHFSGVWHLDSYATTGLDAADLGISGTTAKTTFARFRADLQAFANDGTLGTNTGAVFYCGDGVTNGAWGWRQSSPTNPLSDKWIANVNGSPAPDDITITPTVDTVHTVVMTWDGTTSVRVYVDGALVQTFATAIDTGTSRNFDIGRMIPNSGTPADRWHFRGRIYEVGVIGGTAWSDAEAAAYDADPLMGLSVSTATTGTSTGALPVLSTVADATRTIPDVTATASSTLPVCAGSAEGALAGPWTADSATTLAALLMEGSASRTIPDRTGESSAVLATLISEGDAVRTIPERTATAESALPVLSTAASGALAGPWVATGAAALAMVATAADGEFTVPEGTASSASTLPTLLATGSATRTIPDIAATASATLPACAATGSATAVEPQFTATATATLPGLAGAADAHHTLIAISAATLPQIVTAASATAVEPQFTATGAATLPICVTAASASRTIPDGMASSAATLPALESIATALRTIPDGTAASAATLPGLVTVSTGVLAGPWSAESSAVLPTCTTATSATALDPPTGTVVLILPKLAAAASAVRLPPPVTAVSASVLPFARTSAAATRLPPPVTAVGAAALPQVWTVSAGQVDVPVFSGASAATLPKLATEADSTQSVPQFAAISEARLRMVGTVTAGHFISAAAADIAAVTRLTGAVTYTVDLSGSAGTATGLTGVLNYDTHLSGKVQVAR